MGIWDKIRKKNGPSKELLAETEQVRGPSPNTMVMVLFDRAGIDKEAFETVIANSFGQEALVSVDDTHPSSTHFTILIESLTFVCSYMPFPLPEEEADIPALLSINHFISEEEQDSLLKQQSFCVIAQIGDGKALEGKRAVCLSISRICGALLEIPGACGVYSSIASLLIGKRVYQKHTAIIEKELKNPEYFPAVLWILIYSTCEDNGTPVIETRGLEQFGFLELQFYDPREEWAQSFEKLYLMSIFQITEKQLYKNMDTIAFTKDGLTIFKQSGKKLVVIGDI